jgi:pimeloyl-ACP methyl ester carboxylesterase
MSATFRTQQINIANTRISAVIEPGGNRPVVFLHGNSSAKDVWIHQIALLRRQGHAILAPDLPGHGKSENSPTPELTYSFPGYAAVIGGLIDRMGWPSVDVVGWSLGGHIGLELLATDERVRSLLIVGTPPARPCPEALEQAFHASETMELAGKKEFSEADALAYGTAMMGEEHLAPQLLANVQRTHGEARRLLFASALRGVGTNQRQTVETIAKPLCVVHGEDEPFVRLDYLQSLKYCALWNDRIHVIAGAGHAPHWQCPDAFNKILLNFLRFAKTFQSSTNLPLPIHVQSRDSCRNDVTAPGGDVAFRRLRREKPPSQNGCRASPAVRRRHSR